MLALYRCGRQADALDAYREARAALVEAIGVEPGPELRRLHEAILRQDPTLEPPTVGAVELPPELDARTPLVGREAELASLREHWRHAHGGAGRLVLIAAGRGMGKTRLAAQLAGEVHRDRGAVRYASGAGAPSATRAALEDAGITRRPTLLVLDDVDHAAEDVRVALDELAGAPGCAAGPRAGDNRGRRAAGRRYPGAWPARRRRCARRGAALRGAARGHRAARRAARRGERRCA